MKKRPTNQPEKIGGWVKVGSVELEKPAKKPSAGMYASEVDELSLAPVMAYVPMQKWGQTYEPEVALNRGTIFPELDLPWIGEGACDND